MLPDLRIPEGQELGQGAGPIRDSMSRVPGSQTAGRQREGDSQAQIQQAHKGTEQPEKRTQGSLGTDERGAGRAICTHTGPLP